MKTINLQDYQKDKAIENIKRIIQDMSIDEKLKVVLIGLLNIDMISLKEYADTGNVLKKIFSTSELLVDTLKRHTDTLYEDMPKFINSTNEILKAHQDSIASLELKIIDLEERINKK